MCDAFRVFQTRFGARNTFQAKRLSNGDLGWLAPAPAERFECAHDKSGDYVSIRIDYAPLGRYVHTEVAPSRPIEHVVAAPSRYLEPPPTAVATTKWYQAKRYVSAPPRRRYVCVFVGGWPDEIGLCAEQTPEAPPPGV